MTARPASFRMLAALSALLAAVTSFPDDAAAAEDEVSGPSAHASRNHHYTVQIGALKTPSSAFAAPARGIGPVETSRSAQGLTRYRVGRFANGREAEALLAALRGAGYRDAYVLKTGAASGSASLPAVSAGPPDREARAVRATPELAGLPDELRRKVVYLDGVLHVKEGERFIPLDDHPLHDHPLDDDRAQ